MYLVLNLAAELADVRAERDDLKKQAEELSQRAEEYKADAVKWSRAYNEEVKTSRIQDDLIRKMTKHIETFEKWIDRLTEALPGIARQ